MIIICNYSHFLIAYIVANPAKLRMKIKRYTALLSSTQFRFPTVVVKGEYDIYFFIIM